MGTRPEAIKLAPVVLEARARNRFPVVIVATGQHRDMLGQMLEAFDLRPDVDLGVGRDGQNLNSLAARALASLGDLIHDARPSAVVVQGDTTTAMIGALAAFHARVPVAHLEAGLRTTDRHNPFPEETNRRIVGRLADRHLAPTVRARDALIREGVSAEEILVTGNTVIDALLHVTGLPPRPTGHARLDETLESDGPLVLVTTHRRESQGAPMRGVVEALAAVAIARPTVRFVLPVHPNPAVKHVVESALSRLPTVCLTEPLDYRAFTRVLARCDIVLTDSGGVQEEAPSLGKPVLVLRDNTERPEGVDAGCARLVGTRPETIRTWLERLLDDPAAYSAMAGVHNPYGDGRAAARTVDALEELLGLNAVVPTPFGS